jgi:hypothetical protein
MLTGVKMNAPAEVFEAVSKAFEKGMVRSFDIGIVCSQDGCVLWI